MVNIESGAQRQKAPGYLYVLCSRLQVGGKILDQGISAGAGLRSD